MSLELFVGYLRILMKFPSEGDDFIQKLLLHNIWRLISFDISASIDNLSEFIEFTGLWDSSVSKIKLIGYCLTYKMIHDQTKLPSHSRLVWKGRLFIGST